MDAIDAGAVVPSEVDFVLDTDAVVLDPGGSAVVDCVVVAVDPVLALLGACSVVVDEPDGGIVQFLGGYTDSG